MSTIQARIPEFKRPHKDIINALKDIGTATVAGSLGHSGFRNPHMVGPVTQNRGKSIVGPALTLQFMPQRPDLFSEGEYADPELQLHRHVLYEVEDIGWCELATETKGVNVGISQVEKVRHGAVPTFGVQDIDKARALLERKDVKFDGETREIPGLVKLATFFDPDGNPLMLYQSLQQQ